MVRRRAGFGFFHGDRGLQRAYGTAAAAASARDPDLAQGTDSPDLLVAAIDARPVVTGIVTATAFRKGSRTA
jgi:hypothetical protein